MRVAFLGPEGTFSEEALVATSPRTTEHVAHATIYECVLAVERGETEAAFVPIENSLEGPVNATLDALTFDAPNVAIVREIVQPIHHNLIAAKPWALGEIVRVISLPYAKAQCRSFISGNLSSAELVAASSTADAVRTVSKTDQPWAAIGTKLAAEIYSCQIIAERIEDSADNRTRFVYLERSGQKPALEEGAQWKTSIVTSIAADHPGALLEILQIFVDHGVNLTKIESRPAKTGLGAYIFFIDLEGAKEEAGVVAALDELKPLIKELRILGSYQVINQ